MLKTFHIYCCIFFSAISANQQNDPAANQIVDFKKKNVYPIGIITTEAGAPVEYRDASSVLNSNLLTNEHFVDEMTHFVRERIPERVVHASGTGAFGYFEVTHDITHICKAKLFSEVGKKTPVGVRFSLGLASRGSADTVREFRGFAVKFYTEDGILDLVGLNTPIFASKDPSLFSHIIHAAKRNPATNLPDSNMLWDSLTLNPEAFFIFLYNFSDYGMPDGYRHMSGFTVHTFEVYNEEGKKSYVRFHFTLCAGIKNLNSTEVKEVAAGDPNYFARGLYNSIANKKYPSWKLKMQILSEEDVKSADFDIYDITKRLPLNKYPLHTVGTFTLNKNLLNHYAEMEQIAFCPGNLVPGILGSPDKAFEARCFAYRDAQNYRLSANFKKIPVNCPMGVKTFTYSRDGVAPVNDNGRDSPNYLNSFKVPLTYVDENRPTLSKIYEKKTNNFEQAANFYSNELSSSEQKTLIENLVENMCSCEITIKKRAVKCLRSIHYDLGNRVAEGLAVKCARKS